MGKIKALYEMERGFRLIFQAGGPAFLRFEAMLCLWDEVSFWDKRDN